MASMRYIVLAAVIAAVSVTEAAKGKSGSCTMPSSTKRLYGNSTVSCAAGVACQTAYCKCVGGGNYSSSMGGCSWTSKVSCANATTCAAAFIECTNKAADPKNGCSGLRDLYMSMLAVEGGSKLYNESLAYSSCKYRTCVLVNASAGDNCTLVFNELCKPTVTYLGTLVLEGDFRAILADAAKTEQLAKAIEMDLIRTLKILRILVTRLYLRGSPLPPARTRAPGSRRQATTAAPAGQAKQKLVVQFSAPGVSAQNSGFAAQVNVIKSNGAWLQSTKSAYSTLEPNAPGLSFLGASEGSGSAAFSQGFPTGVPPTPAPPSPGSTPQPGSGPQPGSTPAPGGTTPTTTGAGLQSLLAAVVVAVATAILF